VLYGDFQPSGVVNLVTKQPLDEFFIGGETSYGSYDFKRISGDVTGPVFGSDKVLFRLNAAVEGTESFKDFFERDHYFVAPVMTVDFSPDTRLTLEGEFTHDEFLFEEGIPASGFILPNPNGEIPISRWVGDPDVEGDVINASSLGYRFDHRFTDWLVLRNAFRWERFERHEDTIIPDGLAADGRTLERSFLISDDVNSDYFFQTDVVAEFPTWSIGHELLVGFDFRIREFDAESLFEATTPLDIFDPVYGTAVKPDGPFNNFRADENAVGFYVQDRVELLDNLKLLSGLRYDISQQDQVFVDGETGEAFPDEREDTAFTTQVGIVYQPVEEVSLYANRTESFLPQFGTTQGGEPFDPETGTQYEVGVKVDIGEDISLNLAAFHITKQNVVTVDPDNPEFLRAIGEQESRGFEASAVGEILPGWSVFGSYAFTDTEVTEDFEGFQGLALRDVADHTVSLLTRYDVRSGRLQGLGLVGGIAYVGDREGDDENSFELPGYTRVDVGVFYEPIEEFEMGLRVENLLDEEYALSSFDSARVFPGAPRTIIGTLRVRF
jgi:iron complex outermembrane recepter protein